MRAVFLSWVLLSGCFSGVGPTGGGGGSDKDGGKDMKSTSDDAEGDGGKHKTTAGSPDSGASPDGG